MPVDVLALEIEIRKRLRESKQPTVKSFTPQQPTDRQSLFLSLETEREVFYGGAAGGGKSSALLMAALKYVDVPNYSALLLRRTYADLSKPGALMDRANEWLKNTSARWNDQKKQWSFPSGAKITFGYLDAENDKFNFQCFHPDTELLTDGGWLPIAGIREGQSVATMNPETRELEYRPATRTWAYDYDGELVTLNQRFGSAFAVTPNHSIWATTNRRRDKLKEYRADSLPTTARIPQWCRWSGVDAPTEFSFSSDGHNGRKVCFSAQDWLEFLGWYLSEGNVWSGRWEIKLTQQKEEGRTQIRQLLTRMGVNFHESDKTFAFNNKALCVYLKQFGLSGEKFIPKEVKGYAPEYLRTLLYALMAGDGTWHRGYDQGCYVSTSKRLIDDVCEIALKCGYRATVGFTDGNPEGSPFGQGRRWHVSLLYRYQQDTWITGCTDGVNSNTKRMAYDGKVYCVTVPPYHTVLIRYNGRISWSGQSAEYQYIAFDELSQFTRTQYLYLFSRLRRLKGSDVPLRMRSGSNPGGVGGRWVYDRFIPEAFTPFDAQESKIHWKEGVDEDGKSFKRAFVPARLHDNPHLDQSEYVEALNELDPVTREQLLQGDWQIQERGDILTTYSERHCVISWSDFARVVGEKDIPNTWMIDVYQDVGMTEAHPCVTSWFTTAPQNIDMDRAALKARNGVKLGGSVFLYRGMTVYDWTTKRRAERIKALMGSEIERTRRWQMSHEAADERAGYQREHNLPFQAWPTGKTRGVAQLRTAFELRDVDKPNPFHPEVMGHPLLYLIVDDGQVGYPRDDNGLARHRAEIPAYHWAVPKSGDPPLQLVPYSLFNDAIDTMRAGAADYWPLSLELSKKERIYEAIPDKYKPETLRTAYSHAQEISVNFQMERAKQAVKHSGMVSFTEDGEPIEEDD
jgi:hypothetical protein